MYQKTERYSVQEIPPLGYQVLGEWIDDAHHIFLDITFDFATQSVVDARAWAEKYPFPVCPQGFGAVSKLIGVQVTPGFSKLVRQTLENPEGCIHVSELVLGAVKAALQASSRQVPDWADEKEYHRRWQAWENLYRGRCVYFASDTLKPHEVQEVVNKRNISEMNSPQEK